MVAPPSDLEKFHRNYRPQKRCQLCLKLVLDFGGFKRRCAHDSKNLVPERGLEPPHLTVPASKTGASANFATRAIGCEKSFIIIGEEAHQKLLRLDLKLQRPTCAQDGSRPALGWAPKGDPYGACNKHSPTVTRATTSSSFIGENR